MNEIINPHNLYQSMLKRGWEFDYDLKEKYMNLFKKIKNNDNENLLVLDDTLNENEIKLFSLFSLLKLFNKDYSYYVLIINSLEDMKIKNLFRFMIIKWETFKITFTKKKNNFSKEENEKIKNKNFKNTISEFNNIFNKDKILDLFIDNIINFVDNDKIFLLYLLNIIHEYFCPQ